VPIEQTVLRVQRRVTAYPIIASVRLIRQRSWGHDPSTSDVWQILPTDHTAVSGHSCALWQN